MIAHAALASTGASTLTTIAIGAVGSLVASVIWYLLFVVFQFRVPTVSQFVFWRGFSRDLVVLVSELKVEYDPAMREGEQPPLTPMGDAITLADFLRFLRRRLRVQPRVVSAQLPETFDAFKHQNLLVIGGPKYNYGARALLVELDAQLPYQFRRLRPIEHDPPRALDPELKKFVGFTAAYRSFESDPNRSLDYGCVVMAPNPYNESRKVLIVAGLSNLSTLGASEWLQRANPLLWLGARRRGFEAIVQCRTSGTTQVSQVKAQFTEYLRHGA